MDLYPAPDDTGRPSGALSVAPAGPTAAVPLGEVVSVSGSQICCRLLAPDSDIEADVSVGTLVKAVLADSTVIGLVRGVRTEDGGGGGKDEQRLIEIDLYGRLHSAADGSHRFERGLALYPALGEPIFAATRADMEVLYARPDKACLRVGSVLNGDDLSAYLVTDDLLGKHFAILGTTGGGKSCAASLILRSLLEAHSNGHVLLLDPHNEYGGCFGDQAELVNMTNLELPYWLLNFNETVAVLASREGREHEIEADILRPALLDARRAGTVDGRKAAYATVDTPVPYRLAELLRHIDEAMGKLDKPDDSRPYLRLKARLGSLMSDKRFSFMFGSPRVHDTMVEVISRLFRIPAHGRPMTIIDLSGIPADIVDVVVSLLCRLIFDFAVWSEKPERHPVLLVCEEAHRYIPSDSGEGFQPTRLAISRIAKEGRKYGVSLGLITQRPSEISASVLSQCNTVIAMRMSNEQDQEFVRRTLPENALGLLNSLPSLQTQEAIAIGEGAPIPVRFRFDDLPLAQQPRGSKVRFSEAWSTADDLSDVAAATVERWRRQVR